MQVKQYETVRINFGDKARFVMPKLLKVLEDPNVPMEERRMASRFFVRGGTKQGFVGSSLTEEQKAFNSKVSVDNNFLAASVTLPSDSAEQAQKKIDDLRQWYDKNKATYVFEPTFSQKIGIFFTQTRFYKYMSRVLTLNFGTLRNDDNKTV